MPKDNETPRSHTTYRNYWLSVVALGAFSALVTFWYFQPNTRSAVHIEPDAAWQSVLGTIPSTWQWHYDSIAADLEKRSRETTDEKLSRSLLIAALKRKEQRFGSDDFSLIAPLIRLSSAGSKSDAFPYLQRLIYLREKWSSPHYLSVSLDIMDSLASYRHLHIQQFGCNQCLQKLQKQGSEQSFRHAAQLLVYSCLLCDLERYGESKEALDSANLLLKRLLADPDITGAQVLVAMNLLDFCGQFYIQHFHDRTEAINNFRKGIDLLSLGILPARYRGDALHLYQNWADALQETGDYNTAWKVLNEALRQAAQSPGYFAHKFNLYLSCAKLAPQLKQDPRPYLQEATKEAGNNGYMLQKLNKYLLREAPEAAADKIFSTLERTGADDEEHWTQIKAIEEIYLERQQWTKAIELCKRKIKLLEKNPRKYAGKLTAEVYLLCQYCWRQANQHDHMDRHYLAEAERWSQRYLQCAGANAEPYGQCIYCWCRGYHALINRHYSNAINIWKSTLIIREKLHGPDSPSLLIGLRWTAGAHVLLGETAKAVQEYRHILSILSRAKAVLSTKIRVWDEFIGALPQCRLEYIQALHELLSLAKTDAERVAIETRLQILEQKQNRVPVVNADGIIIGFSVGNKRFCGVEEP